MPIWIRGRPCETVVRAIVFIDADNLLIQEDCPVDPDFTISQALDRVVTFARQITDDPGLYAFVDMQREHPNANRRDLAVECDSRGIRVLHVPSNWKNKDQVDAGIINEWYDQHRNLPLEVPFLLISLDKDFIPMLQETKRGGRAVYIGMPTHHFYPPHVEEFEGFGWLDPLADQHRAMSFLLNTDGQRARPEFEATFERVYPDYRLWQKAFEELSRAFLAQPQRIFPAPEDLGDFLIQTWRPLNLGPADVARVLPYLIIYGYLERANGIWKPDFEHQLLRREAPTQVAQP